MLWSTTGCLLRSRHVLAALLPDVWANIATDEEAEDDDDDEDDDDADEHD